MGKAEIKKILNKAEYPHYLTNKCGSHIFKVFSKKECICITDYCNGKSIEISYSHIAYMLDDIIECTEREYSTAFKIVSDILKSK